MPRRPQEVNSAGEKKCTKCRAFKALDDFPKDSRRSDGRTSACRKCENGRVSDFHKADKDKENKRVKAWRDKNREHVRMIEAEWRRNNPDACSERVRKYAQRHPEKVKESRRRSHARYYEQNKSYVISKVVSYRKRNPHIAAAVQRKRRAAKSGSQVNDFTNAQWLEMKICYKHKCAYCKKLFKGRLTQDHITPLSRGGFHTRSNIVPACQPCNSRKAVGPPLCPVQLEMVV